MTRTIFICFEIYKWSPSIFMPKLGEFNLHVPATQRDVEIILRDGGVETSFLEKNQFLIAKGYSVIPVGRKNKKIIPWSVFLEGVIILPSHSSVREDKKRLQRWKDELVQFCVTR